MRAWTIPAIAAAALTCGLSGAVASEFCDVPKTKDGFIALRAGPGMQFPIVARMRFGDEMLPTPIGKGDWVETRHWRGKTRFTRGFGASRNGWMHKRFIPDMCG
jgi:hypothetical protein